VCGGGPPKKQRIRDDENQLGISQFSCQLTVAMEAVAMGVSVVAVDADAEEAGDAGSFEVRRSGPVTAALTVNLVWDGAPNTRAVTNGSDGDLLAATVVIPAGQAAVPVVFTPVQDVFAVADAAALPAPIVECSDNESDDPDDDLTF
jgi:hypothetical protein